VKKQLFLTLRDTPLPGWLAAFPSAQVRNYPVAGEKLAGLGDALIWLHMDNATSQPASLVGFVLKAVQGCPVIVLSNVPNDEEGLAVLEAGAAGYTSAIAVPDVLCQIETVIENGGLWVGPNLLQRLLVAIGGRSVRHLDSSKLAQLSPREREVALSVAAGATNKEVARQLSITERTVKAHLSQIFETLKLRDRLQLAIFVNGLPAVSPGSPQ
jgi:two-component system, NarL family, nitrate/nitrite response regulator NarL